MIVAIISSSTDGKLFKKKKWLPKLFGKTLGKFPISYKEEPKIVEIIKHVPVIQKVEVIKPVEIIKTVNVPGKNSENLKHLTGFNLLFTF